MRIAGTNKGISRQPINLKIYSPHVLSLTLVDLPGLTKVPIGDQPTDIEKQTRNLISEYIAKPNSLILAVSPANVDIVNSEALKLARYVDPLGKRTIGVLTKIDLMDHGTNALDILTGRVYPLKLGFIGTVNRSQQDIQVQKPLADALKDEADFFRHHPAYRSMANRCGTQYLAKALNSTLMTHIRERLPDIKARLNTLMGQTQQELASYGDTQFSGKEHRGSLILSLMTRFASSFVSSVDGTASDYSTGELCGGARVYYIFNSVFGSSLETINPSNNLSIQDIRTAIRNSTGPRPSLFVPELAFDLLIKPQIKLLEAPSQRCVELVYEELIKICHTCGSNELARFPRLQGKLIEVVSELLRERLGPTSSYVESLISIQRAYINTNHPNFLGAAAAMSSVVQQKQERERRALAAEDKRKRDKRRQKELGVNGVETPEEEEEVGDEVNSIHKLPHKGHTKGARSMSPAVGRHTENGQNSIAATLNGSRAGSPPPRVGAGGNPKDSFLNYFFGREGGLPDSTSGAKITSSSNRHVSQNVEPTFSSSIRRAETKRHINHSPRASQYSQEDTETVISRDYENFELTMVRPYQYPSNPYHTRPSNRKDNFDSKLTSRQPLPHDPPPELTEREALETDLIRTLISSYFNIVRESTADQVPKAIMHLLVNHTKDVLQNKLVSALYKEELFGELLYEDDGIKEEREKCEKLLTTYREAAKIIGEVV